MQGLGNDAKIEMMDGRIWLYRRQDRPTPYWQARFRIDGERKAVVRTTKKRRLDDAQEWAREHFYELIARKKVGLSVHHNSFRKAANRFLLDFENQVGLAKLESADKGRRKEALRVEYKAIIDRYLVPFFDQTALDAITPIKIEDYKEWRAAYWATGPGSTDNEISYERHGRQVRYKRTPKQFSRRTGEMSVLRGILRTAARQGWITYAQIPDIPNESRRNVRRRALTSAQYRQLYTAARKFAKEGRPDQVEMRELLRDYILIMVGSGLRPGREHQQLRWRDVEYVKDRYGEHIHLHVNDSTKTGRRVVVAQPFIKTYLERLRDRSEFTELDDPVFAHPSPRRSRGEKKGERVVRPVTSFKKLFAELLAFAKLDEAHVGYKFAPYSLRHTYATLRLHNGVDVYLLARNMGTSVNMIERHYGHDEPKHRAPELTRMKRHGSLEQDKAPPSRSTSRSSTLDRKSAVQGGSNDQRSFQAQAQQQDPPSGSDQPRGAHPTEDGGDHRRTGSRRRGRAAR